jgi:Zn-dependent peptidase ImmA (M78 family)
MNQFVDFKRFNKESKENTEADYFARCLLMEENMVRDRFYKAKISAKYLFWDDEKILRILAEIFSVTKMDMYKRLKELNLI